MSRNEGGFALVITLIVTALLVLLATEFVEEVYVDTTLSHNFVAGQQASLLAGSGVEGGIALLKYSLSNRGYTTLNDTWAKPLAMEDENGSIIVSISDETAKLNMNKIAPSSGDLIETTFYYGTALRLSKKLGLSSELWETLADWVDLNGTPHPGGAENNYYNALKPSYSAKNGSLDTVEELRLIKGFTGPVMEKLGPYVTIYGQESNTMAAAPVNINTAPKELLAVLHADMTDSLAARIVDYRNSTPFKVSTDLAKVPGLETISVALQTYISVKSSVYRIRSESRVRDTRRVVEAVVRVSSTSSTVLYWREY